MWGGHSRPSRPLIWPCGSDHVTAISAIISPKDFEKESRLTNPSSAGAEKSLSPPACYQEGWATARGFARHRPRAEGSETKFRGWPHAFALHCQVSPASRVVPKPARVDESPLAVVKMARRSRSRGTICNPSARIRERELPENSANHSL